MKREVKILNMWPTDYGDLEAQAILIEDDNEVANIIVDFDETSLRYSIGHKYSEMNDEFNKKACAYLIMNDFEGHLRLPKITRCSKLLQEIYDNVCDSDASMCHITDEDWKEQYSDEFTDEDFDLLQKEIIKYDLQEVIGIDDGGYKIVGYGALATRFNDNRNLKRVPKTFNNIYEVWEEFSKCNTEDEIINLIEDIPKKFGSFSYTISDDNEFVQVTNTYEEYGDINTKIVEFDLETGGKEYKDETDIIPAKKLGEGWYWHKYDDGSGHLESPDGKRYMSYDLDTNEYMETENSNYSFFPLNYYYLDGEDPDKFKPFDYMEDEMIDNVLKRENKEELSL